MTATAYQRRLRGGLVAAPDKAWLWDCSGRRREQRDAVPPDYIRDAPFDLQACASGEGRYQFRRHDRKGVGQLRAIQRFRHLGVKALPAEFGKGVGMMNHGFAAGFEHAANFGQIVVKIPMLNMDKDIVGEDDIDCAGLDRREPLAVQQQVFDPALAREALAGPT